MVKPSITVEICAGDLRSALEAGLGGADRVELCDRLEVGGTTPSAGTIAEACRRLSIPVHVLIRPRAGDFTPNEPELSAMIHDVQAARDLGAAGVVFGMLTRDGVIDREATARLIEASEPLSVTFHKAFDQARDLDEALETLVTLGVDRVLTSGGPSTAEEGADALARLIARAGDRIGVIVAGRLTVENLGAVIRRTGAHEVHLGSAAEEAIAGASGLDWRGVRAEKVRRIMEAVAGLRSDEGG